MTRNFLGVIDPKRAESFLLKLANSKLDAETVKALAERYLDMSEPFGVSKPSGRDSVVWQDKRDFLVWASMLNQSQHYLQKAWESSSDWDRDWYWHELRRTYRDGVLSTTRELAKQPKAKRWIVDGEVRDNPSPAAVMSIQQIDDRWSSPPPVNPFEVAVFYFSKISNRVKRCANAVDCPAPYFLAEKGQQRFCSEACAGAANRESKRRWWNEKRGKGL